MLSLQATASRALAVIAGLLWPSWWLQARTRFIPEGRATAGERSGGGAGAVLRWRLVGSGLAWGPWAEAQAPAASNTPLTRQVASDGAPGLPSPPPPGLKGEAVSHFLFQTPARGPGSSLSRLAAWAVWICSVNNDHPKQKTTKTKTQTQLCPHQAPGLSMHKLASGDVFTRGSRRKDSTESPSKWV